MPSTLPLASTLVHSGMPAYELFELFSLLAMAHFVADFGLQSDRMAIEKCAGKDVTLPWQWWLCSHAAIHGFFVGWLTGFPMLGLGELIVHALIDVGKCRRAYGLAIDQVLHLFCKLLWSAIAVSVFA